MFYIVTMRSGRKLLKKPVWAIQSVKIYDSTEQHIFVKTTEKYVPFLTNIPASKLFNVTFLTVVLYFVLYFGNFT